MEIQNEWAKNAINSQYFNSLRRSRFDTEKAIKHVEEAFDEESTLLLKLLFAKEHSCWKSADLSLLQTCYPQGFPYLSFSQWVNSIIYTIAYSSSTKIYKSCSFTIEPRIYQDLPPDVANQPLNQGFPRLKARVITALANAGITTRGILASCTSDELERLNGMGPTTIGQLRKGMTELEIHPAVIVRGEVVDMFRDKRESLFLQPHATRLGIDQTETLVKIMSAATMMGLPWEVVARRLAFVEQIPDLSNDDPSYKQLEVYAEQRGISPVDAYLLLVEAGQMINLDWRALLTLSEITNIRIAK